MSVVVLTCDRCGVKLLGLVPTVAHLRDVHGIDTTVEDWAAGEIVTAFDGDPARRPSPPAWTGPWLVRGAAPDSQGRKRSRTFPRPVWRLCRWLSSRRPRAVAHAHPRRDPRLVRPPHPDA